MIIWLWVKRKTTTYFGGIQEIQGAGYHVPMYQLVDADRRPECTGETGLVVEELGAGPPS